MSSKNLIAELDFEITSTTKLLHRIPEDRLTWQPHKKQCHLAFWHFMLQVFPVIIPHLQMKAKLNWNL
jgi:hypothetical protein